MKCGCSKCLHELRGESREVNKEEAVHVGNRYYHEDCYQTVQDIKEIIDIWMKSVNKLVNVAQLRNTVNNIVYGRNVESAYLLFGLKYYVAHHINLNYPGGLYYVIQNRGVQTEWKKRLDAETKKKMVEAMKEQPTDSEFILPETNGAYKQNNRSRFSNVIGG